MTKTQLRNRIAQLNTIIDKKIISGKNARKEMAEHKTILNILKHA